MRQLLRVIALTLIFTLSATLVSASAAAPSSYASQAGGKANTGVVIGVSVGVGVLVALVVKGMVTNNRAAQLYSQAEAYAARGAWDFAADTYAECVKVKANYRDAQAKLASARQEAEAMLVFQGDEAKAAEQYDNAAVLYRRALTYMPTSTQAKAKLDSLAETVVAVHYRQGVVYETQNRWAEALAEYEKAYKQNPKYNDVTDRYLRARAQVNGSIPVRAILFFVDRAGQTGLEAPLLHDLQTEMQAAAAGRYLVLDYARVQDVVREQAPALSTALDDRLALDIGKILGADEVVTGEISSVANAGDRMEMRVTARVLSVTEGTVKYKGEITHRFAKGVTLTDIPRNLRELAGKLVKEIR